MAKAPEKRELIKRHLMAHPEDAMNISKLARLHGTTRPTVHAAMKEMGIRGSGLAAKSQMMKKAAAQPTHEPADTPHHEPVMKKLVEIPNLTIDPSPLQGQPSPEYDPLNVEHRKQMLADLATGGSGRERRDSLMDLTRTEQLTGSRKDLGPGPPMTIEEHTMRLGRLMKAIGKAPTMRIFKETFDDAI